MYSRSTKEDDSTLRSYRFIASDRIKQTYTNENKEDVVSRKSFDTSDSTKRTPFLLASMGKKEGNELRLADFEGNEMPARQDDRLRVAC